MVDRKIIHLDLDAFYCAVEEIFNPDLRGIPFAVGGRPETRGVVSSCSYAARLKGVHSALPMARAVVLCPELIILPGRHKEYSKKSKQVIEILKAITPKVEQLSIDEAFLDVTDNLKDSRTLAKSIQASIQNTCGLPSSLGVATNKLVAKIATDIGKGSIQTNTYPNAITIVPPGEEAEFLAPLPLESLWGVGPKTASNLRQLGIKNIGGLAKWPLKDLVKRFGKNGYDLHSRANGIDNRPIEIFREPKSYSQEITFSRDINDQNLLTNQIKKQSERIANSLFEANLLCSTIRVKIRWPDFSTITRQITMQQPTNDPQVIFDGANQLFQNNWNHKTPIRLIGVGVSGLIPPSKQLGLWDKVDYTKLAQIESVIHQVRAKYGDNSIHKGVQRRHPKTGKQK